MRKSQILSTVSAIALTAGVSATAWAETSPNVLVDLTSPTLALTTQAASIGAIASETGVNATAVIGATITGAFVTNTASIGGAGNTENVDNNTYSATAIGNQLFAEVDAGAVSGTGPDDNAAVAESRAINLTDTVISASVSGDFANDIDLDPGATGNTFTLDDNATSATVIGNQSETNVGVDIDIPACRSRPTRSSMATLPPDLRATNAAR